MKRWILVAAAALIIVGPGLSLTHETPAAMPTLSQTPAPPPEELARKSGCFKCHRVDTKHIGPAFNDVSERYKDDPNARRALIEKVRNGGKGNWTKITNDVPMPPHSARVSAANIERLVDWVLGLKAGDNR